MIPYPHQDELQLLEERDGQLKQVVDIVRSNLNQIVNGIKTNYQVPVFAGGAGIGKIRYSFHESFTNLFTDNTRKSRSICGV